MENQFRKPGRQITQRLGQKNGRPENPWEAETVESVSVVPSQFSYIEQGRKDAIVKSAEINANLNSMKYPAIVSDDFDIFIKMAEMFMKHAHVVVTIKIEGIEYEVLRILRIDRSPAAIAVYRDFNGKEKRHPVLRWQHFGFFFKGGNL